MVTTTGISVTNDNGSDANVSVTNSTFNDSDTDDGLNIVTNNAGSEVCVAASGNTFLNGDQLTLTETTGVLRVPGVANAAALSVANGSVTVNTTGTIGFAETCTIP